MWIEIRNDIFNGKDFKGLNYLIHLLTWSPDNDTPRYYLYVDYESIQKSTLFKRFDSKDSEGTLKLLEEGFNQFITESGKIKYSITTENKISNKLWLNIEEAIRFLSQPISIILENSRNDAYFIKAIIEYFDDESLLKEHLKHGWIQFENAGGCTNVQNFIEGKLQSYNYLAVKNRKNVEDYFRGILILDSDKEYPTQNQKPQYDKLETYLESKKIGYHFLEKRAMENYMPDEVYETILEPALQTWINTYKHLSDEQKDFLNIANGFSKEVDEHNRRKPIKAEIKNLYQNLSEANFMVIDKGFKFQHLKNEFPKFFMEHYSVYKVTLKKRANSDELERILQKIKKLL